MYLEVLYAVAFGVVQHDTKLYDCVGTDVNNLNKSSFYSIIVSQHIQHQRGIETLIT